LRGIELIELDARGLAHPEPLERSVAILRTLGPSQALHLVIARLPVPLLQIAKSGGFDHEACEKEEGEWHVFIAHRGRCDLKSLLAEYCDV